MSRTQVLTAGIRPTYRAAAPRGTGAPPGTEPADTAAEVPERPISGLLRAGLQGPRCPPVGDAEARANVIPAKLACVALEDLLSLPAAVPQSWAGAACRYGVPGTCAGVTQPPLTAEVRRDLCHGLLPRQGSGVAIPDAEEEGASFGLVARQLVQRVARQPWRSSLYRAACGRRGLPGAVQGGGYPTWEECGKN